MRKGFSYVTFAEAPQLHRVVVSLACVDGCTADEIAQRTGTNAAYVERILEHPPVVEYIQALRDNIFLVRVQQIKGYHDLCKETIERAREAIKDPKVEVKELASMLGILLKHHPDGMFSKRFIDARHNPGAVENPHRKEMLERAQLLGVESVAPTLEAEFEVLPSVQESGLELEPVFGDF